MSRKIDLDYIFVTKKDRLCKKYKDSALIDKYLKNGATFSVVPGVHYDIFENPDEAKNNSDSSTFTDGKFIWVTCLSYYFKKYCIQLPQNFVDNIRANNYQVPILSQEEFFDLSAKLFFDKTFEKYVHLTKENTSFRRGDIRINENEISSIIKGILKEWLDQENNNFRDLKYDNDKELWLLDFLSKKRDY